MFSNMLQLLDTIACYVVYTYILFVFLLLWLIVFFCFLFSVYDMMIDMLNKYCPFKRQHPPLYDGKIISQLKRKPYVNLNEIVREFCPLLNNEFILGWHNKSALDDILLKEIVNEFCPLLKK